MSGESDLFLLSAEDRSAIHDIIFSGTVERLPSQFPNAFLYWWPEVKKDFTKFAECNLLPKFCAKHFHVWWVDVASSYPVKDIWALAQFCSKYFHAWWLVLKDEINISHTSILREYCSEYENIWKGYCAVSDSMKILETFARKIAEQKPIPVGIAGVINEHLDILTDDDFQKADDKFSKKLRKVMGDLEALILKKNKAYGNSALEPCNIFSKQSATNQIRVRIDDKLNRLIKGQEFGTEDTVTDLLGYLILFKISEIWED